MADMESSSPTIPSLVYYFPDLKKEIPVLISGETGFLSTFNFDDFLPTVLLAPSERETRLRRLLENSHNRLFEKHRNSLTRSAAFFCSTFSEFLRKVEQIEDANAKMFVPPPIRLSPSVLGSPLLPPPTSLSGARVIDLSKALGESPDRSRAPPRYVFACTQRQLRTKKSAGHSLPGSCQSRCHPFILERCLTRPFFQKARPTIPQALKTVAALESFPSLVLGMAFRSAMGGRKEDRGNELVASGQVRHIMDAKVNVEEFVRTYRSDVPSELRNLSFGSLLNLKARPFVLKQGEIVVSPMRKKKKEKKDSTTRTSSEEDKIPSTLSSTTSLDEENEGEEGEGEDEALTAGELPDRMMDCFSKDALLEVFPNERIEMITPSSEYDRFPVVKLIEAVQWFRDELVKLDPPNRTPPKALSGVPSTPIGQVGTANPVVDDEDLISNPVFDRVGPHLKSLLNSPEFKMSAHRRFRIIAEDVTHVLRFVKGENGTRGIFDNFRNLMVRWLQSILHQDYFQFGGDAHMACLFEPHFVDSQKKPDDWLLLCGWFAAYFREDKVIFDRDVSQIVKNIKADYHKLLLMGHSSSRRHLAFFRHFENVKLPILLIQVVDQYCRVSLLYVDWKLTGHASLEPTGYHVFPIFGGFETPNASWIDYASSPRFVFSLMFVHTLNVSLVLRRHLDRRPVHSMVASASVGRTNVQKTPKLQEGDTVMIAASELRKMLPSLPMQVPGMLEYFIERQQGRAFFASFSGEIGHVVMPKIVLKRPPIRRSPPSLIHLKEILDVAEVAVVCHRESYDLHPLLQEYLPWARENLSGDVKEIAIFGGKLAHCLARLHTTSYAHCDLKPANLLINSSDLPVLTDLESLNHFETQFEGRITPGYCVEELEQVERTSRIVGADFDYYSFGIVILEALLERQLGICRGELLKTALREKLGVQDLPSFVVSLLNLRDCYATYPEDRNVRVSDEAERKRRLKRRTEFYNSAVREMQTFLRRKRPLESQPDEGEPPTKRQKRE